MKIKSASRQNGFSLMEIVIVLIIIGILVLVVVNIFDAIERSRANEAYVLLKTAKDNIAECWMKHSSDDNSGPFGARGALCFNYGTIGTFPHFTAGGTIGLGDASGGTAITVTAIRNNIDRIASHPEPAGAPTCGSIGVPVDTPNTDGITLCMVRNADGTTNASIQGYGFYRFFSGD